MLSGHENLNKVLETKEKKEETYNQKSSYNYSLKLRLDSVNSSKGKNQTRHCTC